KVSRRQTPAEKPHDTKSFLPTGEVEFEVLDKEAATQVLPASLNEQKIKELDRLQGVVWGKEQKGLQAGLRITGNRRRFAPGEAVPIECFIRNVGKQAITFTVNWNFYDPSSLPVVTDKTGKAVSVEGVLLTGIQTALVASLQPGETVI